MSTHHGFIKEFPWIRVDAFDGNPAKENPFTGLPPDFHLLTHCHSDHLVGLNAVGWAGTIYCTAITKHLVINIVETGDRILKAEVPSMKATKKFANLHLRDRNGSVPHDRIRELRINVPTRITSGYGDVVVTALDANHCPGSSMFLIEGVVDGTSRAVIVTGDLRAEPWWCEALSRNPIVSKYVRWSGQARPTIDLEGKGKMKEVKVERDDTQWPFLDNIYIDTSAVLLNEELVDKRVAVEGLLAMMREYPSDTKFYINAWTAGYEDLLKGVASEFGSKICLDWYKKKQYAHDSVASSDPHLSCLGTISPTSIRFHACERAWKCDQVWGKGIGSYSFEDEDMQTLRGPKKYKVRGEGPEDGPPIVYVNPWEMPKWRWEEYRKELGARMQLVEGKEASDGLPRTVGDGETQLPRVLICPLARHSALPELRHFVSIFQPRTLYPLTISTSPQNPCIEYRALAGLFGDILAPGGRSQLALEARAYTKAHVRSIKTRSTMPFDESTLDADEVQIPFIVGMGMSHHSYDTNVEGGREISDVVRDWTTMSRRAPPISPERTQKRVLSDSQETGASSSPTTRRRDQIIGESLEVERTPRPILAITRVSVAQSTIYPPSTSTLQPSSPPPLHLNVLGSPCFNAQSQSYTSPKRRRRQLQTPSVPINDPPPPPLTYRTPKTVTFVTPTPSSPSFDNTRDSSIIIENPPNPTLASPELYAPPSSSSIHTSGTRKRITVAPSLASRDQRRVWNEKLARTFGGVKMSGSERIVVMTSPAVEVQDREGEGEKENDDSFRTVSASGSESG